MIRQSRLFFLFTLVAFAGLTISSAIAQQHRATRLGNPATRFAPPIGAPQELRERFADQKLRPDIASILRQWGWTGDLNDLYHAAATAEITEVKMPNGTRMPFMSSRENGKPIVLRDVLWAGTEPISAYAFDFSSKGRRYRCITPRPCSNFFLEDLGAPKLVLVCSAPSQVPISRPVDLCLSLGNIGDSIESKALVFLPMPNGAVLVRTTPASIGTPTNVVWELANIGINSTSHLCATFTMATPGVMAFVGTTAGTVAPVVRTACESRVVGVPALLIDAVDLEDPIETGHDVTYEIKVTNQGSAPCTNLRLECTLPENEEFVSGSGETRVTAQDRLVKTEPVPSFAPQSVVTWRVIVKALKSGDVRFQVNLFAEEFERPIFEEESTHLLD